MNETNNDRCLDYEEELVYRIAKLKLYFYKKHSKYKSITSAKQTRKK